MHKITIQNNEEIKCKILDVKFDSGFNDIVFHIQEDITGRDISIPLEKIILLEKLNN